MDTNSKLVLITGGNSGIGCYLAKRFAEQGYIVFVTVRHPDLPPDIASNKAIHSLQVDVRNSSEIAEAYRILTKDFQIDRLDVLINNAGIVVPGPIETLPVDQIVNQFDVNVVGVLRITKQFLPLIRSAQGKIINVGSMSARMSIPFAGVYGASKSALMQLSWALRLELKPLGIHVFHLEAGNFNTPIWEKSLEQGARIDADIYRPFIKNALTVMRSRSGQTNNLDILWKAVARICENRHTQFNTVVGNDALLRKVLTSLLPYSILENLLLRTFSLAH